MSTNASTDLLIVGGGAAGMMAAVLAGEQGLRVTVIEKNDRLGKKLYITGKGRCNVTNACDTEEFFKNVPRNPRFLYSAVHGFTSADAMRFFEDRGCALKVERGARVFPESDKSASVIDCLRRSMNACGVQIVQAKAEQILAQEGAVCSVQTDKGAFYAKRVLLAVGGCSYPLTGSTGDGYDMAARLGHTIITPVGSLVPLVEKGHDCKQMQGLALKNISVRLINQKGKTVFEEFGELLFTHFGLSGPVILSASAHMNEKDSYTVAIDLKPALDEQKLDARLLRDFEENQNRNFENALSQLLPKTLIPVVIRRSGIDPEQKVHSITRQQRRALLEVLKRFTVEIACKAPVEDAIITSGGVKVGEVDPKTMQSKLVSGLYFAGEILDVDAYTGGFNLQIAWSTANAAANAIVQETKQQEET
ncbi:MAG: NAD(P)/FAD-dependent oxidoreductase [Oscillospiraceae bacterium]|nr:NAD(P)/FAD-dependent oxidoreductase [Oscillospiraceae bacterium]